MKGKKFSYITMLFFLWLLGGQFQVAFIEHLSTIAVAKSTMLPCIGFLSFLFLACVFLLPLIPSSWNHSINKLPAFLSWVLPLREPRLRKLIIEALEWQFFGLTSRIFGIKSLVSKKGTSTRWHNKISTKFQTVFSPGHFGLLYH